MVFFWFYSSCLVLWQEKERLKYEFCSNKVCFYGPFVSFHPGPRGRPVADVSFAQLHPKSYMKSTRTSSNRHRSLRLHTCRYHFGIFPILSFVFIRLLHYCIVGTIIYIIMSEKCSFFLSPSQSWGVPDSEGWDVLESCPDSHPNESKARETKCSHYHNKASR